MVSCSIVDVLLVSGALVLLVYYLSKKRKRITPVPGPYGIPILGYLPFVGNNPAKTYQELSKKYGPILSVKLGTETFTVLNDYHSIQEVLARNGNLFSGRPRSGLAEAFGNGYGIIFHQFDERLKTHRKFVLRILRGFGIDKTSLETKITDELEHFFDEIMSSNEKPVNCRTILARSVSNVICNVTLGSRYSYLDEEFQKMVEIVNQDMTADKMTALCISLIMVAPRLRYVPPFSSKLKILRDGRVYITGMLRRSVEEHRNKLDRENPRDFIDEYLIKMESEDNHDSIFSEQQLCEAIADLFVAGTETTSSTISWALLLLAHRSDIQAKLHEEIYKAIGDDRPAMKHKTEVPYVRAFIHELMRHRPLLPIALPHIAAVDSSFMGYDIPKGAAILPNIWAVHYDQTYFKNPHEFNPERFIDSDGNFINDQRVIPFSVGPRYCVGEQLAIMELFLFISSIVQRFEIRGDPSSLPSFDEGVFGPAYVPKYFEVSFISR